MSRCYHQYFSSGIYKHIRKTFKFQDTNDEFVALIVSEAQDLVWDHLAKLKDVMSHMRPQLFEPVDSRLSDKYTAFHCDIYNRFTEKVFTYLPLAGSSLT